MWIHLAQDAPSHRSEATPQGVNSPTEGGDRGGDPYPGAARGWEVVVCHSLRLASQASKIAGSDKLRFRYVFTLPVLPGSLLKGGYRPLALLVEDAHTRPVDEGPEEVPVK